MTRRLMMSLGAATLSAGLLAAIPLPVSADSSQLQQSASGGSANAAADPCLPPGPSSTASDSASSALFKNGFLRRRPIPQRGRKGALAFARTELFFGTSKPDGVVTDEDFRAFLNDQITPRFPDGLTLVKGDGQFRGESGEIVREASYILILLYPIESAQDSNRGIENIRRCYLHQFDQESVLRVDDPFASWVSF